MRVHAVILVALAGGSLAACGDPGPDGRGSGVMGGGDGALTAEQSDALRALREEESLARDGTRQSRGGGGR